MRPGLSPDLPPRASRPHRPSAGSDSVAPEASTHDALPDPEYYGDAPMTHVADEGEEDDLRGTEGLDGNLAGTEHDKLSEASEDEDEEEDGDDDDDDDDDDDESLCYGSHHHNIHQQHYHQYHQHHHHHHHDPLYHHDTHHTQMAFFDDLDGYISEDLDMSDDAGVPLVDYLQVAQLLTNEMDLDASPDSDDDDYDPFGINMTDHITQTEENFSTPGSSPPPSDPPSGMTSDLSMIPISYADMLQQIQPPVTMSHVSSQLQHLQQLVGDTDDPPPNGWFEGPHPVPLTNPQPSTLHPNNYSVTDFLFHWARQARGLSGLPRERGRYPWPSRIHDLSSRDLTHVQYADLNGDQCDLQGIDWEDLGVTRKEARERRLLTYNNYVNQPGSDRWAPNLPDVALPRHQSYFRFRRMDIRQDVNLSHFQLRNILATTSRTRAFYPGDGAVCQFDAVSGRAHSVMKLQEGPGAQVSTLAADHGALVAGLFNGEYILRHLDSDDAVETACHEGVITTNPSGITNHIQVHQARGSSAPLAAFASNDTFFRVLDVSTEKWLSSEQYPFPLNCTALSPDKRLRVMVGDDFNVLITAAESSLPGGRPDVLHALSGHRDYGFACDWADDGWTVATGFQDKSVKIWDARWWSDSSGFATPVCTIRAEMAGVRGLRFSPIGSGKRVLVAAEEADFINIIDAQTFRTKQTIDIFGEIGGINFSHDGQELTALCCDNLRGGLLQLERCGLGRETRWVEDDGYSNFQEFRWRRGPTFDWPQSSFTDEKRIKESASRRRRKAAALDAMEPF
ncbi:WD domain-protein [Echria macrotheca]|uniref:WD domain-protein n=1 Tax=Echria macrotheca TaxID=438768 RepID=A0AAJ0BHY0_9PEZI|nr:WD domain-protein [Echria macrotheca]